MSEKSGLTLAVDIGNTTIECGIFDELTLLTSWQLTSERTRTSDECWMNTAFFCRDVGIDPTRLNNLSVASVVPRHTGSFVDMAKQHFDDDPLVVSIDACPFLKIKYTNPRSVGADRLCNAYAGYKHYSGPLIVVDFGTSVTFDTVDESGAYLGGVILPGPVTIAQSLHKGTAQLPQVAIKFPDKIIGDSTEHAIQVGLTWGMIDMVDALIDRIITEFRREAKVIATGGFAATYAEKSRKFSVVHPHLVLEGIVLLSRKIWGLD